MSDHRCRACRSLSGQLVLDLGEQPACDYFPQWDDPGPDPVYPLQMWLCAGLPAGATADRPHRPRGARGARPAALVAQAADAVARVGAAGLLPAGARVTEYGSPHGGSWLGPPRGPGACPGGGGGAGGRRSRLLRADARARPGRRARRTRRAGGAGRPAAAPVPLPRRDHPAGAVERPAARALRLLLHHRAHLDAGRGRFQPAHVMALRPLRRNRAPRRQARRRRPPARRGDPGRSRRHERSRRHRARTAGATTPARARAIPRSC